MTFGFVAASEPSQVCRHSVSVQPRQLAAVVPVLHNSLSSRVVISRQAGRVAGHVHCDMPGRCDAVHLHASLLLLNHCRRVSSVHKLYWGTCDIRSMFAATDHAAHQATTPSTLSAGSVTVAHLVLPVGGCS